MNELKIFKFKEAQVRTVVKDGEPWFVVKDVCEVLGLSNPTMVIDRLDDDERAKFNLGRQGRNTSVRRATTRTERDSSDTKITLPF